MRSDGDSANVPRAQHRILFVCTGNLCRSPMAEFLLKHMIQTTGAKGIRVGSAGVIAQTGEPAPENAIAVLEEHGIDLSPHRSKVLTQEMVDWADRIVVMEEYHRRLISRYFKNADGRIGLISEYAGDRRVPREIHDPYGELKNYYRKTFHEIRRCVAGLFARISDV